MTINMYFATLAWFCLVLGYFFRRHRRKHLSFVLTGILLDISLVIFLQFTRSAIQTAISFELSILEQLHIAFSTTALICYFPTLYFGLRLLSGSYLPHVRIWHKRIACFALATRTLGFLFMFSMIK